MTKEQKNIIRNRIECTGKILGLTNKAFADRCSMEMERLEKLISGKRTPTLDDIMAISYNCNVTADFILGYTENFLPIRERTDKENINIMGRYLMTDI